MARIEDELDAIGTMRCEHKRLREEARAQARKIIPRAIDADVAVAEIARRTSLGRDSVYEILREAERG